MTRLRAEAVSGGPPAMGARRRWLTVSRAASVAYTACFLVGTVLSVRRGHKAAALGIRTPFSVPVDVAVGMGTGLAAPWQLIAGLWGAQRLAGSPGRAGRRGQALVAFLGAVFLAGSVAEPISHRLLVGRLRRDEATLVVLDLALPITMLASSLASLVESVEGAVP